MLNEWYLKRKIEFEHFMEDEQGDTNFISIMLIIVIIVGLATAFKQGSEDWMSTVTNKVTQFLGN